MKRAVIAVLALVVIGQLAAFYLAAAFGFRWGTTDFGMLCATVGTMSFCLIPPVLVALAESKP